MTSNPFLSTSSNIFDENRCVFAPALIAGKPVLVSQDQSRKIFDTLTTSVAGNQLVPCPPIYTIPNLGCPSPFPTQLQVPVSNQFCNANYFPIQAQRQDFSGASLFTFPPSFPSGQVCPNYPICAASPPPAPMATYLQRPATCPQIPLDYVKYTLEALQFQEQMRKNPFKFEFHYDKQTATDEVIQPTCVKNNDRYLMERELIKLEDHCVDHSRKKGDIPRVCFEDPCNKNKKFVIFPEPKPNKYSEPKKLIISPSFCRCTSRDFWNWIPLSKGVQVEDSEKNDFTQDKEVMTQTDEKSDRIDDKSTSTNDPEANNREDYNKNTLTNEESLLEETKHDQTDAENDTSHNNLQKKTVSFEKDLVTEIQDKEVAGSSLDMDNVAPIVLIDGERNNKTEFRDINSFAKQTTSSQTKKDKKRSENCPCVSDSSSSSESDDDCLCPEDMKSRKRRNTQKKQ